eukprot:g1981.t1
MKIKLKKIPSTTCGSRTRKKEYKNTRKWKTKGSLFDSTGMAGSRVSSDELAATLRLVACRDGGSAPGGKVAKFEAEVWRNANLAPLKVVAGAKQGLANGAAGKLAGSGGKQQRTAAAGKAAKAEAVALKVYELKAGKLLDHVSKASAEKKKFYGTTAINYANGAPHMGHAYEGMTSDVITRYHRVFGRNVFFLTGTDEHGQKMATTAEKAGVTPKELCDSNVKLFQALNEKLLVKPDFFVRTTMEKHYLNAQTLWKKCQEKGDIYLGEYEGWYNVKEEAFVTDADAEAMGYKDAAGKPLQKMKEASYFFRMSNYQDRLIKRITEDPGCIQPNARRNEVLARLKKEPLRDLSISRTTFDWGIPVPGDAKHVMYVWFDALSNYLTGVDGLVEGSELAHFWPADLHVIGKDIIWFHCVLWPAFLWSAELPVPKCVFAHGMVNDAEGEAMSKSKGNGIDPQDVLTRYSAETLRYYVAREVTWGGDLKFSESGLIAVHNADLADAFGNLFRRGLAMCGKAFAGKIPDAAAEAPFDIAKLALAAEKAAMTYDLKGLAECAISAIHETNKYLQVKEPWKKKDPADKAPILRTVLEACYVFAHFMRPFTPVASDVMFQQLNTPMRTIAELSASFDNLVPGTSLIVDGPILFQKYDGEDGKREDAAKQNKKNKNKNKNKNKGKDKGKGKGKKGKGSGQIDPNQDAFTRIDVRVGRIVKAWEHPNSTKLWCEQVDVGEDEPRNIASGLRHAYPEQSQLENRLVLVVCNLKPAKLGGFKSEGMVLCAKDEANDVTEFVDVPAGANVGERVFVEGLTGEPLVPNKVKKLKAWEAMAEKLVTSDEKVATWDGKPVMTSAGPCTAPTVKGGLIR